LAVVGSRAQIIGQEALLHGLPAERTVFAASKAEVVDWLRGELKSGDYLLVKASRGAQLEEIVEKVRAGQ
jgi:UDP-N-acetylmuramoyl-tripeptide--D-alanyl-D-alanine ligase